MIKFAYNHSKGLLSSLRDCLSVPIYTPARHLLGSNFPPTPRFTPRPDRIQSIAPLIFQRSGWQPGRGIDLLKRQTPLKVVSWNIKFNSPGPATRVASILQYLRHIFGNDPDQMAILLQEVCQESADEILKNKWVQENFAVVGQEPPQILRRAIARPARYFTLAMVSKNLRIDNTFRMTLPSQMGRDGLFIDLPLKSPSKLPIDKTTDVFRLCTTHLESLAAGKSLRAKQLRLITKKLNEQTETTSVIAGLVGGNMNTLYASEITLHRQFGLQDAREDISSSSSTTTFQSDDREVARPGMHGHTWFDQSKKNERMPKCLDRFLYTGGMQTLPLAEIQDRIGNVAWLRHDLSAQSSPNHISDQSEALVIVTDVKRVSVSDHLGIAMNVAI
jgi:hypothetical protein